MIEIVHRKGRVNEMREVKFEQIKIELHRIWWNLKNVIRNRNVGLVLKSAAVVIFVTVFSALGVRESMHAQSNLQQQIASEIIRFHVIANSDLDEDQQVKLKVKDAVVTAMRPIMAECTNKEEARRVINNNSGFINQIATKTLQENGYDYSVSVTLQKEKFPIKVYGDITLPAGEYEALCVRLGKAEGHNWWCIVFPSLCYVDETYCVVPEESKQQLQSVLTEEEYKEIAGNHKMKVKVRFKIWDYFKKYL